MCRAQLIDRSSSDPCWQPGLQRADQSSRWQAQSKRRTACLTSSTRDAPSYCTHARRAKTNPERFVLSARPDCTSSADSNPQETLTQEQTNSGILRTLLYRAFPDDKTLTQRLFPATHTRSSRRRGSQATHTSCCTTDSSSRRREGGLGGGWRRRWADVGKAAVMTWAAVMLASSMYSSTKQLASLRTATHTRECVQLIEKGGRDGEGQHPRAHARTDEHIYAQRVWGSGRGRQRECVRVRGVRIRRAWGGVSGMQEIYRSANVSNAYSSARQSA